MERTVGTRRVARQGLQPTQRDDTSTLAQAPLPERSRPVLPALPSALPSPPEQRTLLRCATRLCSTEGSGASPPAAEEGSGSGGREPSEGRWTVVKQMLYSCRPAGGFVRRAGRVMSCADVCARGANRCSVGLRIAGLAPLSRQGTAGRYNVPCQWPDRSSVLCADVTLCAHLDD